MEMVSKYLMLEIEKKKEELESKIFTSYTEINNSNQKSNPDVKNQIYNIFPTNRYDEGMKIISLLEEVNHYVRSETYNERRQRNLVAKLEVALKTIESI